MSEDEIAGCHHKCSGHELGQASPSGVLQSIGLRRVRHHGVTEGQQQSQADALMCIFSMLPSQNSMQGFREAKPLAQGHSASEW